MYLFNIIFLKFLYNDSEHSTVLTKKNTIKNKDIMVKLSDYSILSSSPFLASRHKKSSEKREFFLPPWEHEPGLIPSRDPTPAGSLAFPIGMPSDCWQVILTRSGASWEQDPARLQPAHLRGRCALMATYSPMANACLLSPSPAKYAI